MTVAKRRRALELRPEQLRRRLDPRTLPFRTTAEVEPLEGTIGQPRALEAIEFGLDVETVGYNLFVAGSPGSGRTTTALDYLERASRLRPVPDDWVYVHNFADPERPAAIDLPAGRGAEFSRDMDALVAGARRELPRAFESEAYERRQRELLAEVAGRRDKLTEELRTFAHARNFALETTPTGVMSAPLLGGKPITRDQFESLPKETRREIEQRSAEMDEAASRFVHELRALEKEATERARQLEQDVARYTLDPLLRELRDRYAELPAVLAHLDQVEADMLGNLSDLRGEEQPSPLPFLVARQADFGRYRVNVLVDHAANGGAPVVYERNPTYYNLFGRVDYRASFGTMVTDFQEIRAGALHRANGGFLVLDALEVLRNPFSWEALKRALLGREIRIENLGEHLSAIPTAGLRPKPIPLALKVVLVGTPYIYQLLYQLDDEFRELFKVKADFAPEMDWDDEHFGAYAAFISRWARTAGLRHFDRGAVARVIEHGGRLRESQRKLSTRLLDISDVVSEASFWAGKAGHEVVRAEDVDVAIATRERRSSLPEERVRELIAEGTLLIDVDGARVGCVNGLSILDLGDHAFGKPTRVSARVSVGRGTVTSIEREIELSGPIHSKGVLILSGFLAGTYGQARPLALQATLTFEQSYDEVEGDSASSTELYAVLSALSGLPLDQGIAVTGSVNQYGEIQPVGGVTRKVEGFFAACKAKGLTGKQGVIVPASNVPNLMLDDEVVQAVRARRFHVWAVSTVEEGMELLTGKAAGVRQPDGTWPKGSVHALVDRRLAELVETARAFAEPPAEQT